MLMQYLLGGGGGGGLIALMFLHCVLEFWTSTWGWGEEGGSAFARPCVWALSGIYLLNHWTFCYIQTWCGNTPLWVGLATWGVSVMLKKYLLVFSLLVHQFDFCNHPVSFIFMLEVGALQVFYCYNYFATQGSKPVCGVCVCVCVHVCWSAQCRQI